MCLEQFFIQSLTNPGLIHRKWGLETLLSTLAWCKTLHRDLFRFICGFWWKFQNKIYTSDIVIVSHRILNSTMSDLVGNGDVTQLQFLYLPLLVGNPSFAREYGAQRSRSSAQTNFASGGWASDCRWWAADYWQTWQPSNLNSLITL